MTSLLLDRTLNDLCLDSSHNIAVAGPPYSVAQDVACAVKTFQGEVWYDVAVGVPYFSQILGRTPSIAFLKAQLVAAALTAPGVTAATCFLSAIFGREMHGQLQVTDKAGGLTTVGF